MLLGPAGPTKSSVLVELIKAVRKKLFEIRLFSSADQVSNNRSALETQQVLCKHFKIARLQGLDAKVIGEKLIIDAQEY